MLYSRTNVGEIRQQFRKRLAEGKLMRFPGAISALTARLIEEKKFEGVYISGAVVAAQLGLPDIGLTTLTEVGQVVRATARMTNLPVLVDADTGFGEIVNTGRTIQEFEDAGAAGCHFEDQINPKRCGHLDNKQLIDSDKMCQQLQAAVSSKRDKNFLVMARTDARGVEGLEKAIERAKAYVDAGAEMIFPEALQDEKEFEAFRKAISVPLLANMTEFGKSSLLSVKQLEGLGYNIVIFPVTLLRTAMGAIEQALDVINKVGTQESLLDNMQTRSRLYDLVDYKTYATFDKTVFDFKLKNNQ